MVIVAAPAALAGVRQEIERPAAGARTGARASTTSLRALPAGQRSATARRLLENAGRRSAEAAQEKLNVIAEALAPLMASRTVEDHTLEEAVTRLRDPVASKSATEPGRQPIIRAATTFRMTGSVIERAAGTEVAQRQDKYPDIGLSRLEPTDLCVISATGTHLEPRSTARERAPDNGILQLWRMSSFVTFRGVLTRQVPTAPANDLQQQDHLRSSGNGPTMPDRSGCMIPPYRLSGVEPHHHQGPSSTSPTRAMGSAGMKSANGLRVEPAGELAGEPRPMRSIRPSRIAVR